MLSCVYAHILSTIAAFISAWIHLLIQGNRGSVYVWCIAGSYPWKWDRYPVNKSRSL